MCGCGMLKTFPDNAFNNFSPGSKRSTRFQNVKYDTWNGGISSDKLLSTHLPLFVLYISLSLEFIYVIDTTPSWWAIFSLAHR